MQISAVFFERFAFRIRRSGIVQGRLTRREDLEFGKTAVAALESAADTCHWTNCTPQHAKFNQGKSLWQGLEGYVLEQGLIKGNFEVQVFTGPILEEDDPVYKPYPQIQYPVRFWKVLAVLDENDELFATAYILDQSEVIAQYGIEEAAPYGAYQTFQVAVEEVERLTGLTFTCDLNGNPGQLRDHDPLPTNPTPRRRRTVRTGESSVIDSPEGYRSLQDLGDVILK
ncbi:MAG TPA: DNA/RNA non-specific endonuclease [Nitrosospira sp.]|nr:DNA/RNA non-specific endonuclease [Nitrosospira sp.]